MSARFNKKSGLAALAGLTLSGLLVSALSARELAVEVDFAELDPASFPEGAPFQQAVTGEGEPGDWQLVQDDVPAPFTPFTGIQNTPERSKEWVVAQTDRTPKAEHSPLLIYTGRDFKDFTLTTRFKITGGALAQAAGIAFRVQDPQNYYVLRASAYEKTFRFFKYVQGHRGPLIGPERPIETDTWYRLKIKCSGNQIDCWLDGERIMPTLNDSSFGRGRIAFWTDADTVAHFAGLNIDYRAEVSLAERMIASAMDRYPRLVNIELYSNSPDDPQLRLIASHNGNGKDLGKPAGEVERDVVENDTVYFGDPYKGDKSRVSVVYPLDDRNGAPIAAVRFIMKDVPGLTEKIAVSKALSIKRYMQSLIGRADYLTD